MTTIRGLIPTNKDEFQKLTADIVGRSDGPSVSVVVTALAFMSLAATGTLAAIVALTLDAGASGAAFSCALAAAVNLIACLHYRQILRVRMRVDHRLVRIRSAVDALRCVAPPVFRALSLIALTPPAPCVRRHSDWLTTLPLLVLDLFDLASHATRGVEPLLAGTLPLRPGVQPQHGPQHRGVGSPSMARSTAGSAAAGLSLDISAASGATAL